MTTPPDPASHSSVEYLVLLLGVFACSTAVLMIKASSADPLVLVGARTLVAALALAPAAIVSARRQPTGQMPTARDLAWSVPGAILLAVHFITWTIGARSTSAANATLLINLTPVALPLVMAALNHERITRAEIGGTLIAIAGVLGLLGRNYQVGARTLRGDIICLLSMVLFSAYLAFSRRVAQRGQSLLVYLAPLYAIAGIICLTCALAVGAPFPPWTMREVLLLVGLGLIPTVIGHSILNHSIRVLRGQTVSTINLLQLPAAAVMAYYLLHEPAPPARLYTAAAVIVVGILVVIRATVADVKTHQTLAAFALVCLVPASEALAQTPPPAPKIWTVAAGAGLALTSGNTDTSTVNASYEVTYDPQRRNIVRSDGLIIRGTTNDETTADRLGLNVRDEYRLNTRIYVFGQNQYLRDRFKNIQYLLAPTGGIGAKISDTATTKFGADLGVGGVWEKNNGIDVNSSGAITLGEKLAQTLTPTTTLTQSYAGLWKTGDFGDSLHVFSAGVAASMSTRTQLKVEFLDTYKNQPPLITIKKNDVAVLVTIVYKM